MDTMRKTILALSAAAILAAALATPAPAEARGLGLGLGLAGGLIGGAIIGSAIAAPRYYGPGYGYYGPNYRYAPLAVYDDESGCRWTNQQYWDGYAWRIRRVPICG